LIGTEDEHFRRLLEIEKDVKLIDDVLELICRDFDRIQQVDENSFVLVSRQITSFVHCLEWTTTKQL
jgi:hypothetical protein